MLLLQPDRPGFGGVGLSNPWVLGDANDGLEWF